MNRTWNAALAALLVASPALAGGGAGYTVNIHTTTSTIQSHHISEVLVTDVGTHTFPDPYTAPELSQSASALSTALTALSVPMGTTATETSTLEIDDDETVQSSYISNCNPTDHPDCVIGDPDDYFTWIAVGNTNVDVYATQVVTQWSFYRMTAELDPACTPGSYSANGQEPCTPCPAGYSQPGTGATSCTPCAAGTFASGTGNSLCANCAPGTYELDTASTSCDECPGGQATPCNDNGVCSDGPTGNGTCTCDVGYSGFACENGPPTTTVTTSTTTSTTTFTTTTSSSTTTTSTTSTTSTTLLSGPCAELPESGCVAATSAVMSISKGSDPAKNKLKWKLSGGSLQVNHIELGDPAFTNTWTLCVYDSTAGVPSLAASFQIDPGATLWTNKAPKGWKYKNTNPSNGITGASLKAGEAGKPKASVKGAGVTLALPLPASPSKFFEQGSTVTVQFVKGGPGTDLCWTSDFEAADTKLNTPTKFKAAAK